MSFRMSIVDTTEYQKTILYCQMSLGCLYEFTTDYLEIDAVSRTEGEIIIDALVDAGGKFLEELPL